MLYTTLILIHVCGATIGLISGALSMIFPKGSGLHRVAGTFFVVSMLAMSGAGAYMAAFIRPNIGNVMGGVLAFYLVSTAWKAGRRRERRVGAFDIAALVVVTALVTGEMVLGVQAATSPTHTKAGYPAALFFIFGTLSLLFALSDVRMIVRGGVEGAQRIARHLWRMGFAFLLAALSFFPGQAGRFFTKAAIRTPIYYAPHLILLIATIYWLVRVRSRKRLPRREAIESVARAEAA